VHGQFVEGASDVIHHTGVCVPIGIGTGRRRSHCCGAWLRISVLVIAVPTNLGSVTIFSADLALRL
jgi:hypothetical protein